MNRKLVLGSALVIASGLTLAMALASGVAPVLADSGGNCVQDLIRKKRAEGLVLTNATRVANGDGTVTGIFTFCPPCSESQPPCQAPCELAVATLDLKTGELTCR
jgi:hypothetical protein